MKAKIQKIMMVLVVMFFSVLGMQVSANATSIWICRINFQTEHIGIMLSEVDTDIPAITMLVDATIRTAIPGRHVIHITEM